MLKTLIGLSTIIYGSLAGALDPPPKYRYEPYPVLSKLQRQELRKIQNFQKSNKIEIFHEQPLQIQELTSGSVNENEIQEPVIRKIEFHQSMNGHFLNKAEKEANKLIEQIISSAQGGITPQQLQVSILEYHDSENGLSLILNCGKALRHIKLIEGGNPFQRWLNPKNLTLFDLSLLKLSESLLLEGKKLDTYGVFNRKRGWNHQLRQTRFHQREVIKYLSHLIK
jgi:hypothetical protein